MVKLSVEECAVLIVLHVKKRGDIRTSVFKEVTYGLPFLKKRESAYHKLMAFGSLTYPSLSASVSHLNLSVSVNKSKLQHLRVLNVDHQIRGRI